MQEVARADDQSTVILGHIGTLAVNPYIFDKLPYDANKDFQPVSLLAKVPSLYVVHPDVPVKNLRELIAYAKKKPGQLSYGSAGNGSAGHLAFEYLKMTAEIFMLHVPYRGTGPMMTDLMSGRLDAASVGAAALLPFIKAGKGRCIATGSTQRLPQLPDVPTVAEQGFPGFEMTQWYGMLAPSSMTRAHVDKLAAECAKAVKAPDALKRLQGDAAEPIGSTPQQFAQFIATERSEEHTSELQSPCNLVCRLLLEKKKSRQDERRHRTAPAPPDTTQAPTPPAAAGRAAPSTRPHCRCRLRPPSRLSVRRHSCPPLA